jgi:hypothetical protein
MHAVLVCCLPKACDKLMQGKLFVFPSFDVIPSGTNSPRDDLTQCTIKLHGMSLSVSFTAAVVRGPST